MRISLPDIALEYGSRRSDSAVTTANIATPSANNIYVWDITAATQTRGHNTTTSISVVVRRDSNTSGTSGSSDAVVSSANVTVELRTSSGSLVGTASGTTDKNGQLSGSFSNLANGTYVAEVTVLTHKSYTWNKLLDPTPNDTDLDGDNLPDQQFTVAAAGAAKASATAAASPANTGAANPESTPASASKPASEPAIQKHRATDRAILAVTKGHARRALLGFRAAALIDVVDESFAVG